MFFFAMSWTGGRSCSLFFWKSGSLILELKEIYHGTFRTSKHFDSREYHDMVDSRRRSRKNDQAKSSSTWKISLSMKTQWRSPLRSAHAGKEMRRTKTPGGLKRKAETAVDKSQDDLARAALDRSRLLSGWR